ncbi:uncharacterized protein LOC129915859 isoform X2 [Episyrphus balteatus]|uniref:uncharacterized protein LOC129915859 isoform X2 n=1 Tax=Episyrphus balteatus TaxID=286459 RepID=UPI002485C945|nr:uncharacterized protein LOC129915859 isoform X2 [Episyrphus balteatus]
MPKTAKRPYYGQLKRKHNFKKVGKRKQTKMNPIKLLKNQNNGTNLQYKEYQYHKSKNFMTDDGLIQYWVCQHRLKTDPIALPSQKKRYLNCSATMHTLEKDGQISVKKEPTDHSCSVIDAIQKARETFIAEIRNIAATSSEKPAEIIQNYKATKTIEELKYLPSDKALIRSIQRYQKRIIQQSSDENPEATTSHKASNQKNALNHNVKNEENEFNGTDTQSRTDEINTTHQNITQQNENGGNKVDITTSRKRRLQVDNLEGKLEDALQCIKSMQNKIAKRDEHSIFGELIAHNIRICNPSKKEIAIAQHHIENVIFNLTMGVYSKRGSSHLGSTDSYNFTESTENLQHTFDRVVTKTEPYL